MGQTYGIIKAYPIENAGGVAKNVCVVQGVADGNCKLPGAANAPGFLGVTVEAQANQLKGVAVCRNGIVNVLSGGVITRGDRVGINSALGDVCSIEASIDAAPGTAKVWNVVGRAEISAVAGDIFPIWLLDFQVNQSVS